MSQFKPKEVFRAAKEAEKIGKQRTASGHYASLSIYLRRIGKLKDAKALINRAIRLSPESPRLYLQLALVDLAEENEGAAQAAIRLFARYALQKENRETYLAALETELVAYPALRQIYYESLLQLERTSAGPFLLLADAYRDQGRAELARRALLDALKTKTQDDEVLAMLKEVVGDEGKEEWLVHLRQYEGGKLSRADLIVLLSSDRVEEERPEPPLATAAENEEKNLQTLIKELEAEMGIDLQEKGDESLEPLIREFRRKSEKILAGDAKARMDMALAFFEMGLMDEARDELRNIKPTDSLYLEAQCLLGEILYAENSDLGALEVFQKCLRDERATQEIVFEAKYKLIQIYLRLGDLKQALHSARELEKKAPTYRDLRNLRQQVEEMQAAAGKMEGSGPRRLARKN